MRIHPPSPATEDCGVLKGSQTPLAAHFRSFARDPVNVRLVCVFVFMSVFYLWRTAQVAPLALHGGSFGQYNALADAFLHLHLWIAHFSASRLAQESLNGTRPPAVLLPYGDDSVYNGNVYLTWGPTPALVLLIPLHLLGFEPSPSVVIAPFAIVGLGFTLAVFRVCLRALPGVPPWVYVLSALVLACASVVLDLLRGSNVYQESIAAGYCFTMAGVYVAVCALASGKASLLRLGLMSLCFGLACGARVPFYATFLLLVPVFLAFKDSHRLSHLLVALAVPAGLCVALLLTYNFVRYGSLLETGERHVIIGSAHEPRPTVAFLPVGMWSYLFTPPRVTATFPFISVVTPQLAYPFALPRSYFRYSDLTGGVVPMVPIVCFAVGLPWLSRAHDVLIAALRPLLITMVGTGLCMMMVASYAIPTTTERYEGEYTTLLMLGGLVVWLSLSTRASGRRRRFVRIAGGALAVWSCVAGLAVGLQGMQTHTGTWRALVDIASPVSTVIVTAVGHPILTEVWAPTIAESREQYGLSAGSSIVWLSGNEQARMTVASPDARNITIAADVTPGVALSAETGIVAVVSGSGPTAATYQVPADHELRIGVHVHRGVNEFSVGPVRYVTAGGNAPSQEPEHAILTNVHLVGD